MNLLRILIWIALAENYSQFWFLTNSQSHDLVECVSAAYEQQSQFTVPEDFAYAWLAASGLPMKEHS